MKALLTLAFTAALSTAAAAQAKSGLDNPTVPIAPASTPQPANALNSAGIPGATSTTTASSPVPAQPRGSAFRVGSALAVRLTAPVDSGANKNGDPIHATLAAPVRTTSGTTLPAGTRVLGTVVSSAKAGTVQSGGILSIQLTRVGSVPVVTDVLDFSGQEGHKDVADSAPQKGAEAVAQAGPTLQFQVLENGPVPGVIRGAKLPAGGKSVKRVPTTAAPASGPSR